VNVNITERPDPASLCGCQGLRHGGPRSTARRRRCQHEDQGIRINYIVFNYLMLSNITLHYSFKYDTFIDIRNQLFYLLQWLVTHFNPSYGRVVKQSCLHATSSFRAVHYCIAKGSGAKMLFHNRSVTWCCNTCTMYIQRT